ncbi:MAG: polysaccharide pyruvyl transferase family protein [Pseudomonadota bacterium]
MRGRAHQIGLFGAAPDTGNQGVSALCYGTIAALRAGAAHHGLDTAGDNLASDHLAGDHLFVFDHGRGIRPFPAAQMSVNGVGQGANGGQSADGGQVAAPGPDGAVNPDNSLQLARVGASWGKRVWRPEHYRRIALGLNLKPFATEISEAIAGLGTMLDLSGGDSFADLYGAHRFDYVMQPKRLAQRHNKRLILLPQTYGPFHDPSCRAAARDVTLYADRVWARDRQSFGRLRDLLADDFDADRHLLGVDMALGMTPKAPRLPDPPAWLVWLVSDTPACVGINVSGLIANSPEQARGDFGLNLDYIATVKAFINHLLSDTDCNILLIPHVVTDPNTAESDIRACQQLFTSIAPGDQKRVAVAHGVNDAQELKWLISQLDWFCGTRLHATIAGLSSAVPTATLAYSLKAEGIFQDFKSEDHCADMRHTTMPQALDILMNSYANREQHRPVLQQAAEAMHNRWCAQAYDLHQAIRTHALEAAA